MTTLNSLPGISHQPLAQDELSKIHAYWRAANYLSVGQIYLYANPLLREPLKIEHVKRRLLGHWGTTPGLNFIYVHLNRVIRKNDLNMIYIAGPGHGGPGIVANVYLEGTYSEVYPNISQDEEGIKTWYLHWIADGLAKLEAELARGPTGKFSHGDAPTMADCCLVPQVFNARRYEADLTPYPTIMRVFGETRAK